MQKRFTESAASCMAPWPEGVAQMRAAIEQVATPVVQSVRRRGRWADAGDELSRDRLYAGQLETMWRTTSRVAVAHPTRIRVVVQNGGLGNVTSATWFARGAAGIMLADTLATAGYMVELVSASYSTAVYGRNLTRDGAAIVMVLQSFGQPLNLQACAEVLGRDAWFRTATFAMRQGHGRESRDGRGGYTQWVDGSGGGLGDQTRAILASDEPGVRTVYCGGDAVRDLHGANEWVRETVAALESGAPDVMGGAA